MGRNPKREYSNGRCLIRKSKNLNHSLTNSKHRIPHQRQNLIATTGFVVLLFLLQVSLSDLPHLPASCEALRSLSFLMPMISKVSLYIWQRYQRWGCREWSIDNVEIRNAWREIKHTSDIFHWAIWLLRLLTSSSAVFRKRFSFWSNFFSSATSSAAETLELWTTLKVVELLAFLFDSL